MPMPRILRLCRGQARGKKEDTTDDRRGTKEGKGQRLKSWEQKLLCHEGPDRRHAEVTYMGT